MRNAEFYKKRKERLRIRSRLGVLAREKNRLKEAAQAVEVGRINFSGAIFNGSHEIRCLIRDGEEKFLLDFDGKPHKPVSYRGILRLLSKRLIKTK